MLSLLGAKPLSEPVLAYSCKNPKEKLQWNFNRNSYFFIEENVFENVDCEKAAIFFWLQCVKITDDSHEIILPPQWDFLY